MRSSPAPSRTPGLVQVDGPLTLALPEERRLHASTGGRGGTCNAAVACPLPILRSLLTERGLCGGKLARCPVSVRVFQALAGGSVNSSVQGPCTRISGFFSVRKEASPAGSGTSITGGSARLRITVMPRSLLSITPIITS